MTMRHNNREMITAEEALSYRLTMAVTEAFKSREGYGCPICPRCRITLEREYQAYCDRCEQAFDWKKYGR